MHVICLRPKNTENNLIPFVCLSPHNISELLNYVVIGRSQGPVRSSHVSHVGYIVGTLYTTRATKFESLTAVKNHALLDLGVVYCP